MQQQPVVKKKIVKNKQLFKGHIEAQNNVNAYIAFHSNWAPMHVTLRCSDYNFISVISACCSSEIANPVLMSMELSSLCECKIVTGICLQLLSITEMWQ